MDTKHVIDAYEKNIIGVVRVNGELLCCVDLEQPVKFQLENLSRKINHTTNPMVSRGLYGKESLINGICEQLNAMEKSSKEFDQRMYLKIMNGIDARLNNIHQEKELDAEEMEY